jgi:hypothetical protein
MMNYGGHCLGKPAGAGWVFGMLIRLAQYAAFLGALLNLGRGRGVGIMQALLAGCLLWLHRRIAIAEVLPPELQSPYQRDVGCIWLIAAPLLSLALLVWVFGF